MGIFVEIVAAVITLLLGDVFAKLFKKVINKIPSKENVEKSYSERLSELTSNLNKSTIEVDRILSELGKAAKIREDSISKLEQDLFTLEERERETKQRIEDLQKVPLEAVDHFTKLIEVREKRSAKRDYLLFGAGVIVSTLIAILLKIFGWG